MTPKNKTVIGVIGVWLHNHPNDNNHKIEFTTDELKCIYNSLNELDRLRVFKKTFDEYELAQKQGFIAYENWKECEKELETMKAKVKRYFELKPDVTGFHKTDNFEDKWKEFHDLEKELKEWSEKHV